jgi:hypothetical protein
LNNRIKELRDLLGLKQEDFAEAVNLKRNSISLIELGKRNASDRTIKAICSTFNVNEEWLRHGSGEVFKPACNKLSAYLSEIDSCEDEFIKSFIEVYMELDESSRCVLKNTAKKMAEKYIKKEQN